MAASGKEARKEGQRGALLLRHSGALLEMPEKMCAGHLTMTWEFMGNDRSYLLK